MLPFLNIFLMLLHFALIGFNLSGWIWLRTRRWHLLFLLLTAASWSVLGYWYGWGYCVLTDWHWKVKTALGEQALPASFVKYYADKVFGKPVPANWIDGLTLACLLLAVLASLLVNLWGRNGWLRKKKQ